MITNVEGDQRKVLTSYEGALTPLPPLGDLPKDSLKECIQDFHSIMTCGYALAVQISVVGYPPAECHTSSCTNGRKSTRWVTVPLPLGSDKGSVRPLTRSRLL